MKNVFERMTQGMILRNHAAGIMSGLILAVTTGMALNTAQAGNRGSVWNQQSGSARDIGVNDQNQIWVIGTNQKNHNGFEIFKRGGSWDLKPGAGHRIDVGPGPLSIPWMVNQRKYIFKWHNGNWQNIPGFARDIGVGGGKVWIIGKDFGDNNQNFEIYKREAGKWLKVPGCNGIRIDVDRFGRAYVVNRQGNVYRWTIQSSSPNGGYWFHFKGVAATDIGVGREGNNNVSIWVIGKNSVPGGYGIYKWETNKWVNIPGGAKQISVGQNGLPWVINSGGQIFRRQ